MVTVATATSATAPHLRWRWVRRALVFLICLLLAGFGLIYGYVRLERPQMDGRLELAGLEAPVTLIRDSRGIAHIRAGNIHDLVLAQGFAMAQDRLWQMDLMRRLGEGRLAEVFGPVALAVDKGNRQLGLGRTAAVEAGRLSAGDAALLSAFAQGVNDYMTRRGVLLPLEFRLLGYRPEAWQPRDSLALAAYMYNVLASGYESKLMRETFLAKLGPALGAQLFPESSPWDVPPGAYPGVSGTTTNPRAQLPVFPAELQAGATRHGGSNNWVLSGAHSFNGQPILANDPHLQFQIPGLWWAAELSAPQVHVAGVAITGVPGVIIGHNDHIAWGVTNSMADVQDLYRETLDGKGNVLTPYGWQPLRHWHEVIGVKGQAAVSLDIAVTPHGPLIASDGGGKLALAWSLYAPGALQAPHVFFALDEARNWQEFESALAEFAGPPQNFVYADTSGHIGYQLAGWVPQRRGFDGAVPVPGSAAAYAWRGWVPFGQLPRVFDPPSGIVATANGRVTPDGYRTSLSTTWDAPNRTRRLYALLGGIAGWNARAMGRVQTDVISEQDRDFAARVVAAGRDRAGAQGVPSPVERQAGRVAKPLGVPRQSIEAVPPPVGLQVSVQKLQGFRGDMSHTSVAATLTYQTRQELLHEVLAAKVGPALADAYRWDMAPVFEQWLLQAYPRQWLPPGYTGPHAWDQLLLHCLEVVAQRQPQPWGHWETLSLLHPIFSRIPLMRGYADLGPVELDGSPLTVKQARNTALGNRSTLGPSMRFIADLGNWDESSLTLVTGESGRIFDPHYRDEFSAYLRGQGLPLWFSAAAVAAHQAHQLTLDPSHPPR